MRAASQVGLADLAEACLRLEPDKDTLRSIAQVLGIEAVASLPAKKIASHPSDRGHLTKEPEKRPSAPESDSTSGDLTVELLRAAARDDAVPEAVRRAKALSISREMLHPAPQPLLRPQHVRAFLHDHVAQPVPSETIDIEATVEQLARLRLRKLPRRYRRGFRRGVIAVFDRGPGMDPFREDVAQLRDAVHRFVGPHLLRTYVVTLSPFACRFPRVSRPGVTVLLVSDLGIGRVRGTRRSWPEDWIAFSKRLLRLDQRVIAIVPYAPQRWPRGVGIEITQWRDSTAENATPSRVDDLARALSIAGRIDAALVRAARRSLFPTSAAGLEADFLFSSLLSVSTSRAIVLHVEELQRLRAEIAERPSELERARRFLVAYRRIVGPESVALEEDIVYFSLRKWRGDPEKVEELAARILRTLLERGDDPDLARWSAALVGELPEWTRELELIGSLDQASGVRLGLTFGHGHPRRPFRRIQSWLLPPEVAMAGIARDGKALIVREPAEAGDATIEVPSTNPRVVIVHASDATEPTIVRFRKGEPGRIQNPVLPLEIETLDSGRVRVFATAPGDADADAREVVLHETGIGKPIHRHVSEASFDYDVFVVHASEDKARFVDSFVRALEARGLRVWYDTHEIRLGDDFRKRMDEGLARSRFGLVVLSPNFFKFWHEAELSRALVNQDPALDLMRILPIRLEIDHPSLMTRLPLLAARAALGWELGPDGLANRIHDRVRDALPYDYDVFVSHASEDKARFVDAFVAALKSLGLRVWYDSNEIRVGDDFRKRMDEGLAWSQFGVVVLSPNFFKFWPEAELSALFNQESVPHQTRILPIRLDIDQVTMTARSPLLGARAVLGWELGVHELAKRINDRVRDLRAALRRPRSPVYNLPPRRARELFGRDSDLAKLEAMLAPGRNVRIAASIEGLAGVGKTELALHLAYRLSETGRFPGGIFWLDAENPDLTVAWGTTIADALGAGRGPVEERAAAAVRIASRGEPVLVILDNVERWTRETEPRPLPSGPRTALLVTTRHRDLAGRSFAHFELETLPEEAARAFLFDAAGRDLSGAPGTADLLRHLDGHTLAIELAGAYLREFPAVTPAAYLKKLTEGAPVEEKVQDLVRYESTVGRALDVQWKQLDHAAREALLVAACFAPEAASTALLESCGVDAEARQPLRRLHLIRDDGERWRMHHIVREWARRAAPPEELALARRRFVKGCADFTRGITIEEGYRVYRADGPHLEEAMRDAEAALGADDPRVSRLFNQVATALQSVGELRRAKELLEQALESDLKNLGEDHPFVANSYSSLALVLKDLGEFPRAKELLEQALESDLKNLGEEHPSVANGQSNLALVLRDVGELPRAKELLEQALESDLKNLGEEHPSVAIRRSNLALVLQDLGELPRAKELLEQALESALKNLGEEHPSVATRRSNLATVLQDLGELGQAKELLEQALESDLKNLGGEHPSVAIRRFNLATVARDSGDLVRARELFVQTLTAQERSLGTDHPSTSLTRVSLASALHRLGETGPARAEAERALRAVEDQPEGSWFRTRVERLVKEILSER